MACKLHRVRYYNPKPEPINCVSFNKANKTLAVARFVTVSKLNTNKELYCLLLIYFLTGLTPL